MCIYIYIYTCIYIYIYMYIHTRISYAKRGVQAEAPFCLQAEAPFCLQAEAHLFAFLHPVSVRRFPPFRTQPLENLTPLPMNKRVPEQPSPWRKSSKRESCYGVRVYDKHVFQPRWESGCAPSSY